MSLPINPNARIISSESRFRRRGAFLGFVLLDSYFKNLATSLRISSAEMSTPAGLLSFFSLEPSLLSWREVLHPRPDRPPYPMPDYTFNTHACVVTQKYTLCFWAR